MRTSNRPLSPTMIRKLRDCYEKQTGKDTPCLQDDLKGSLAALYKRGLVDTRMEMVNGKRLLCVIVTDAGAKMLDQHPG